MLKHIGIPTLLEIPSLEDTIDLCLDLGLYIIEVNMTRPKFLPKSLHYQKVLDLSATHGIEFTLHLPEEMDLGTFHDPIRDAWIEYLSETIQWANSSGIKLATMHLWNGIYYTMPDRNEWLYDRYQAEYLKRIIGAFEIVFRHKPNSFQLCIENCGNFHLPFIKAVLDNIDVGLTWDVGHDAEAGYCDKPYLESNFNKIRHVHLHDVLNGRAHKELFTGEIDIDRVIHFIVSNGIKAIIEVKTIDSLRKSIERLRSRYAQHQVQQGRAAPSC
jgi:sugar phosphate isomerase/epimerase